MVVSDVRDGPRGAWRSLSGDVEKPIARRGEAHRATWRSLSRSENTKNSFSHSLSSLYIIELCRTLQNFAFRRGANFRFRKFAYENSEQ